MIPCTIMALLWLGIGMWQFIEAAETNGLICFAISTIWLTAIKSNS